MPLGGIWTHLLLAALQGGQHALCHHCWQWNKGKISSNSYLLTGKPWWIHSWKLILSSFFFSWTPFSLFPFSFLNCEPLIQLQLTVFQFSFQFTHHPLSLSAACTFVFWLLKLFPCLYFYFWNFCASPSSPSPLLRPLCFSFSRFSVRHY